ncbi:MAG: NUDIX domain-containing protein [Vulcanimicrobiaceae bacterium]
MLVDFDLRWNLLFVDENGEANGPRAAHSIKIVDGKKFDMCHSSARVSPSAASILHGVSHQLIRVASALLVRTGRVLLVASSYQGKAEPLWFLPGGRPKDGELLHEAVVRETAEETGLVARVIGLRYVSESISPSGVHIVNHTFGIEADGEPHLPPAGSDHIVDLAFVPIPSLRTRMGAKALWEPLFAHLCDALPMHYAGYPQSDFEPPVLASDENLF